MKQLVGILCLFCCYRSYAQLSVDSIKTEADIEAFVKQYGEQHWPDWKTQFSMHSNNNDYWAEERGNPDSSLYLKWIFEDFNNDGKRDLLFSNIRKYHGKSRFFSLISNTNNKYDYFNLQKTYHHFCSFDFEINKKDSVTLLYLNENKFSSIGTTSIHYFYSDTLIAAFGGFVEKPKRMNKQVKFDTLEFNFSPSLMWLQSAALPHGMRVVITSNNKIQYEEGGRIYNGYEIDDDGDWNEYLDVEHSMHLNKNLKVEIDGMLSLAEFTKSKYLDSLNSTHTDRATLRIKANKKEKLIVDDGLQGTYWLRLFYTKMFAISKRLRTDMAKYFQKNNFYDWK